jgi:hypothetical protein
MISSILCVRARGEIRATSGCIVRVAASQTLRIPAASLRKTQAPLSVDRGAGGPSLRSARRKAAVRRPSAVVRTTEAEANAGLLLFRTARSAAYATKWRRDMTHFVRQDRSEFVARHSRIEPRGQQQYRTHDSEDAGLGHVRRRQRGNWQSERKGGGPRRQATQGAPLYAPSSRADDDANRPDEHEYRRDPRSRRGSVAWPFTAGRGGKGRGDGLDCCGHARGRGVEPPESDHRPAGQRHRTDKFQ